MLQIVEQTKEEKMAMYMKLPKKQIAEMLINCNDIITALTQVKNCSISAVSGRSEQLSDSLQDQIKRGELDPYSPHAKWIKP